jgi:hypothetical protein
MLDDEVTVTVTREEHHQAALAPYAPLPGGQRRVAVELGWCVIGAGKYQGEQAIEVRLDGRRVGELTYLMSRRYAPMLAAVASHGGRPGCAAVIERGGRGLQVELCLPREGSLPPQLGPTPVHRPAPTQGFHPAPVRRGGSTLGKPAWIAAGVVGGLILVGAISNALSSPDPRDASPAITTTEAPPETTTTAATTTTSTTTTSTTTTSTTTTQLAPPPAPVAPVDVPTTTKAAPKPKPPKPAPPAPPPMSQCDPNYSGCVPVASDVDCAGGSGNGPAYVKGPVTVIGSDIYDLDRDGDGTACED